MTFIIGHRGAAGTHPENTMVSFQAAFEAGAEGIELDVQMTKDGELVVIHDETVDRTTNGTGYVKDLTLSQLVNFDASYSFAEYRKKASIPTLEEVLRWVSQQNNELFVNVELKNGIIEYQGIEQRTIDLIFKYHLQKRVIVSSFNHYSLVTCKEIAPEIETAVLYMESLYEPWNYAARIGAKALHPHFYAVNPYIVDEAKSRQVEVRPFTVNDKDLMEDLIRQGTSAFFTDFPKIAVELRTKIEEE